MIRQKNGNIIDWNEDRSTGDLVRTETTVITQEFLDEVKALQNLQAARTKIGDMMHVARIPGAIHRKWVAEGFDPAQATDEDFASHIRNLRKMVARLQADGMENFIIDKRTF